jgi:hypothetical protein
MTAKQFFDWQTVGGTDDVMRFVDCMARADISRCAIGGAAVNYWAAKPVVTQDVDLVVATEATEKAIAALSAAGFRAEQLEWSANFRGDPKVSLQLSTEAFYRDFPQRAEAADVHGSLLRVASVEDTLAGKIKAWSDTRRRQSKRLTDLGDIARLVESHRHLWQSLPIELQEQIENP